MFYYGPEQKKKTSKNSHLMIHFPTYSGANEWAQWSAQAKQALRSKQMCEGCKQMSKRIIEWPKSIGPILKSKFLVVLDHSVLETFDSVMYFIIRLCHFQIKLRAYTDTRGGFILTGNI